MCYKTYNLLLVALCTLFVLLVAHPASRLEIINGREVRPHSVPYAALVTQRLRSGQYLKCGGVLISENYVLTAAHCIYNIYNVRVYLGKHNLTQEEDSAVIKKVEKCLINATRGSDIALLKLETSVKLNKYIQTAKLPSRHSYKEDLQCLVGKVYGWGNNAANESSAVLRSEIIGLVPLDKCKENYPRVISPNDGCVIGIFGQETCTGDDGGPLVIRGVLAGIVKANPCLITPASGRLPSLYTRIPDYLDWIKENSDAVIPS